MTEIKKKLPKKYRNGRLLRGMGTYKELREKYRASKNIYDIPRGN